MVKKRERVADLRVLREWRGVRVGGAPGGGIGDVVREVEREVGRRARAVGGIGAAWEVCAPDRVKEKCEVVGLVRGVLTVRVRDAAARYELDRWWRSGGEREVCAAAGVGVRRLVVRGRGGGGRGEAMGNRH